MATNPRDFKRLRRYEIPGHARALNFSCFHTIPLLRSDRACNWLIRAIDRALLKYDCALWAWCIMPTHAHILVYPRSQTPAVGRFASSIKRSTTNIALAWITRHTPAFLPRLLDAQPNGSQSHRFWQRGGGYDRNLWSPRHIWNMIDYIHNNPVEARLCTRAIDWPWSSATYFATRTPGPLPPDHTHLPPDPRHP